MKSPATESTETPSYYLANATETLSKAGKKDGYYSYRKYVRGGSNYAYMAVLVALDPLLPKRKGRRSIDDYRAAVSALGGPTNALEAAYDILHRSGGYDGVLVVSVIAKGIEEAKKVITWAEKVKRQKGIA